MRWACRIDRCAGKLGGKLSAEIYAPMGGREEPPESPLCGAAEGGGCCVPRGLAFQARRGRDALTPNVGAGSDSETERGEAEAPRRQRLARFEARKGTPARQLRGRAPSTARHGTARTARALIRQNHRPRRPLSSSSYVPHHHQSTTPRTTTRLQSVSNSPPQQGRRARGPRGGAAPRPRPAPVTTDQSVAIGVIWPRAPAPTAQRRPLVTPPRRFVCLVGSYCCHTCSSYVLRTPYDNNHVWINDFFAEVLMTDHCGPSKGRSTEKAYYAVYEQSVENRLLLTCYY